MSTPPGRDQQLELLQQAKIELEEAQRRVLHLQQVVDGLTGLLYPPTRTGSITIPEVVSARRLDQDLPSARQAVLRVLQRNVGRVMTPRKVYEEVINAGLVNPTLTSGQAAYDVALRRLVDEPDSMVARDDAAGGYVFRPAATTAWERGPVLTPSLRYRSRGSDREGGPDPST